jgi:hypothetical protein
MNAVDHIHHVEHRTRSRDSSRFERAWGGDAPGRPDEPTRPSEPIWSADDFAD